MERLSVSFGARSSPLPRESLNRSSLQLSPVEEAAEQEEDLSPFIGKAQQQPLQQQQPPQVQQPKLAKAAPRPVESLEGRREMVAHPIAGVQVSVPQSRLPALFDRRYSTRRIIRNFTADSPLGGDDDYHPQQQQPEPSFVSAALDVTAGDNHNETRPSEMDFSMRRASMRQSLAPGELPLADFLWLANVRFADEQLVAPVPPLAVSGGAPTAPSLCSVEIAALESEMAQLQLAAETLRDEIAAEEEDFSGSTNALFTAVQTSEQSVLEAVQTDLAKLKRLCLLQAESEALEEGLALASEARAAFRKMGEQALSDTRAVYALTGAMHHERESLRAVHAAAQARLSELRASELKREQEAAQRLAHGKVLGAVFESLTHCRVLALDAAAATASVEVCEVVRVEMGPATFQIVPLDQAVLAGWRGAVLRASGLLGTFDRTPGSTVLDVVRPCFSFFFSCCF